jgi:hypothetical protein
MTCKQLGGACDEPFEATSFDEMAEISKRHGNTMFQLKDAAHLKAMASMMKIMKDPVAFNEWMADRKKEFESLPDD